VVCLAPLSDNRKLFIGPTTSLLLSTSTQNVYRYRNTCSLFTPPTRTRQNCLDFAMSCPCWRCEQNWRQDRIVLSCFDPVSNLQLSCSLKYIEDYWKLRNSKLGRDKTKLSCLGSICVHNHTADTDKRRQSCLIRVGGVNKLRHAYT